MKARYAGEPSHLRIWRVVPEFLARHLGNFGKRIVYNYFLRDFTIASLELVAGLALLLWGVAFGAWQWALSLARGQVASSGTIMLAALPVIVGIQLLLAFLSFDMSRVPQLPLHPRLPAPRRGSPPPPAR